MGRPAVVFYRLLLCVRPDQGHPSPSSLMMEYPEKTVSDAPFSSSYASSSSSAAAAARITRSLQGGGIGIQSPCGACKVLRRRCSDSCLLAPYFPPTDPMRFINAHRVFGASNIVKCLQELPEWKRADAVSSMVYEANARIRDPVYGCAGAISNLQKQLNEVQAELAMAQAEILVMRQFYCQQQQQNANAIFMDGGIFGFDHWEPTQ